MNEKWKKYVKMYQVSIKNSFVARKIAFIGCTVKEQLTLIYDSKNKFDDKFEALLNEFLHTNKTNFPLLKTKCQKHV